MKKELFKIAILAPFYPQFGGMAQLAIDMSKNLINDGHKVSKINLTIQGPLNIFLIYFDIFKACLLNNIIHIISCSGLSLFLKDLPAILIAKIFHKKTALHFVGGAAVEQAASWPWYKRLPFYLADVVVVPTRLFADGLINNNLKGSIKVIPHVVELKKFNIKRNTLLPPKLLAVKNLDSYAGYENMIEIFSYLQKEIPEIELWIIGSGPMRKNLDHLIEKNKIKGIKFLGSVPNNEIPKIMAKSSLLLHCTKYESFGLVLVEAMAIGLPVVAFSIGGIPEVITDSKTGYLVPYGDNEKFKKRCLSILRNNGIWKDMSNVSVIESKKYEWENISRLWYNIYYSL